MSTQDNDLKPEEFGQAAIAVIADARERGFREAAEVLAGAGLCGVCAAEDAGGLALGIGFALPIVAQAGAQRLQWPLLETMLIAKALGASPLVKPQAAQMVCSAMGGMKMVVLGDLGDLGDIDRSSDGMDCPLCTQVSAPPTPVFTGFAPPSALAHALRPIAQAHIAWLSGSPLPPRGPPVFS